MLDIEVTCDCCGRSRALTMPFRGTRGLMAALDLGVDHFRCHGFVVWPDGRHACRWCERSRLLGVWWGGVKPRLVTAVGYAFDRIEALVKFACVVASAVFGEAEGQ